MIKPGAGGSKTKPIQISLTSVTSISKYSAKPAQTPAIFLSAITRRSRFGAAAGNDDAAPPAEYPGGGEPVSPVRREAPHPVQ